MTQGQKELQTFKFDEIEKARSLVEEMSGTLKNSLEKQKDIVNFLHKKDQVIESFQMKEMVLKVMKQKVDELSTHFHNLLRKEKRKHKVEKGELVKKLKDKMMASQVMESRLMLPSNTQVGSNDPKSKKVTSHFLYPSERVVKKELDKLKKQSTLDQNMLLNTYYISIFVLISRLHSKRSGDNLSVRSKKSEEKSSKTKSKSKTNQKLFYLDFSNVPVPALSNRKVNKTQRQRDKGLDFGFEGFNTERKHTS